MATPFKSLAQDLNSRAEYEAAHEEPKTYHGMLPPGGRRVDALERVYADELAEDDDGPMWVPPSPREANVLGAQVANMLVEADRATNDKVVLPNHYARFKIEPVRFVVENALNFFQGNVIKYILRYDAKNGIEDLKKARRYLDMFIRWVEGDPDWWTAKEAA